MAADSPADDFNPVVRTIGQREIVFDSDGFFNDFSDWSEEICILLAGEAGLAELTDSHWRVIRFLREFYAGNGRAPLNNQLQKGYRHLPAGTGGPLSRAASETEPGGWPGCPTRQTCS